jgi:hypothetical protein
VSQKFEELHLSITPINREKYHYLVRTEESPKGVLPAEEQVIFPVEEWLEQASRLMDDSVAGLWHGYGFSESLEDDFLYDIHGDTDEETVPSDGDVAVISSRYQIRTLVDLGREMYEALFQGDLRDRLTSAIAIAHNQGAVLRLRLGLKDSILPRLPWEVIHEDSRPIATGKDVIFSRYQPTLSSLILPPPPSSPLKILMVVAAPTDKANLALKQEANALKAELKKPTTNGTWGNTPLPKIELDILEHPDREKLTQVLEQNSYHVLHYSGHSNLGYRGGELYLVNQQTGLGEVLNGDDLAGLLVNNGIHLAVFNSCRSTHSAKVETPETNNPRNLAEVLVNRGIPAVLAMAERIPDQVALTLTRLFYYNLKQGYPVDLSLNRARQGLMSTYGSDQLYWALPVLYLHEKYQGYLTQQPSNDTELFIPPRPTPNSRLHFRDITRKANSNGAAFLWRNSPSEPDNLADDLADDLGYDDEDDEAHFFRPSHEEFLDGEDEFLDEEMEDEDEHEFLDYDLGEAADNDAESLVSDIFSELGFGKPGSAEAKSGKLSAKDEFFPNIPGAETEVDDVEEIAKAVAGESQLTETNSQTKSTISSAKSSAKSSAFNLDALAKPAKSHKAFRWRFGVISFLAIALFAGAIGFWRSHSQTSASLSPSPVTEDRGLATSEPTSEPTKEKPNPLEKTSTPELSAIAIENFAQGKLSEGVIAVNLLLDRGALPQAKATLEAVPNQKKNTPEINFLSGRLAWQFVQTGNKDYSVSDARRFWESSVKIDPNSTLYANALAFAYYAEGNLDLASDMWLQVVTLLEPTQALDHPDALTAYAGLALVMMKSSEGVSPEEKNVLLSKATKQRKMVMKLAANDFQPDALAKNWMWPESAISDWQKLLTLEH